MVGAVQAIPQKRACGGELLCPPHQGWMREVAELDLPLVRRRWHLRDLSKLLHDLCSTVGTRQRIGMEQRQDQIIEGPGKSWDVCRRRGDDGVGVGATLQ